MAIEIEMRNLNNEKSKCISKSNIYKATEKHSSISYNFIWFRR